MKESMKEPTIVNLNRNFIGMELDETHFNIATNRIQEAKNNKTLF